jgi:hypothetical protein
VGDHTLTLNTDENCISFTVPITGLFKYRLFSNKDIPTISPDEWLGDYDGVINSIADNIGVLKTTDIDIGQTVNLSPIIIQNVDNIYMTSPNLGSFDTVCSFSNNVIKKIPVTVDYGYMIVDQFMATNDYLNCSNQTIIYVRVSFTRRLR